MNLVVVESPAKAKTIERYLGSGYKVVASFGHVRDLPKSNLGVDVDNNFEPKYLIPSSAKKTITTIKELAAKSSKLYLATDLDREGEAISWHILEALKWKKDYQRITFSEITKTALENALKNARKIDMNLVDAQQARRVLDRLVGYKLSPLLWKKIKSGLSAGRVQSVAVRLIVEREREIRAFVPQEFWQIQAELSKQAEEKKFKAGLFSIGAKKVTKLEIKTKSEAEKIKTDLKNASYSVGEVTSKKSERRPSAPFTTSTLQMEASRKLGYSAKQTMMLAQRLYEAGKITYMRTDSTNLSKQAVDAIREQINMQYGSKYLPAVQPVYQTKTKKAQEAHEAIRPSKVTDLSASNDSKEQKLYELIWKRAVASQMSNAIFNVIEAHILTDTKQEYTFFAKGESLAFDGFIRVYSESRDEEDNSENISLPDLKQGEKLDFWNLFCDQKFTEPPKRYSEAMLVKKLESMGIGRPSTYAPTLSTIQDRGYVKLAEKRFYPEEIGEIVNDFLVNHFNNVVNYDFTAKMEDEFDFIADGERDWRKIIADFYAPFSAGIKEKEATINKSDIIKDEILEEKCPECNHNLVIKLGRYGKFIACSNYPKCKYSRPIENKEDATSSVIDESGETETVSEAEQEKCEKCGGAMKLKEGRFGKFLACENYPKCKNTKAIIKSSGIKCPECNDGEVVQRRTKKGRIFWGCSKYPKCKYATWEEPNQVESKK